MTGGSINTNGRLVVETSRVGGDTMLAGIQRLVESAWTGKAEVQRLADRVSAVFVPAVLALAIVTFVARLATGHELSRALAVAVTVLIIACPCALGPATPTALLVGTGRGGQLGTLIKGPQVLEDTRRIDTVVLDFEAVDDSLVAHASGRGGTTVFVGWDGVAQAALTVQDSVRKSSVAVITRVEALGLPRYLLTGDGEATAKAVAHEAGNTRSVMPSSSLARPSRWSSRTWRGPSATTSPPSRSRRSVCSTPWWPAARWRSRRYWS